MLVAGESKRGGRYIKEMTDAFARELAGQVASFMPRIDDRAHRRRRKECCAQRRVIHQGLCQGENCRAAERTVTSCGALVSLTSVQLRRLGMHAPGSKGDLESFHR